MPPPSRPRSAKSPSTPSAASTPPPPPLVRAPPSNAARLSSDGNAWSSARTCPLIPSKARASSAKPCGPCARPASATPSGTRCARAAPATYWDSSPHPERLDLFEERSLMTPSIAPLSRPARVAVLAASFAGLLFDGWELGLMPIASLSVAKSLLGAGYTEEAGGEWFAWLTAALMFGAAVGGIWLGQLGDRIGRVKAMALSI